MALVPVVALWALCPLLAGADQPPVTVTVTAATGEDACLPCGTQRWGDLRGVTLSCTHQAGGHRPVPVLSHRLGWHPPPTAPGWHPPVQPDSRFRGRVAFCAAGTGDAGVSLLLRNLSDPDFGNYSCYASRAAAPQLLCSLVLLPAVAEVPKAAGPDMILVVCVLTAAFTAVAIGVLVCAHGRGRCWGRRARGPAREPGAAAGGEEGEVALGDLKSLNT
ncbi:uncharacterized protein LOC116443517 [Corvus moneduloides]|uniref:uncharacterized protein LOC116443517 n=1 Tax=Corvus moneduloides TaxID=1196302 RepID=UPI001363B931|nr:uncharacterized protein LOC116443517 [Corvus moneduloides]